MAPSGKNISSRAAVVWEFNKPVSIETIEVEPPQAHEVRVKIVAVGVCHSDLGALKGEQGFQPLPYVMGHEGAGIVESIGPEVTSVKPGDKVFAVFVPRCGKCEVCLEGRVNNCLDIGRKEKMAFPPMRTLGYDGNHKFWCKGKPLYHYTGSSSFSDYVTIAENSCVKINQKADLEKVVLLSCGFSTGYGSSANAVDIQPGQTTAVWGLGGVGLATVLGCRDKGAGKIIGIDINPDKEAIARKMGCTDFICLKDLTKTPMEVIGEMTNGGVHYAFVCTGNTEAMEVAVFCTGVGGTTVIVGVGDEKAMIKVSPAWMLGGRTIIGRLLGNYNVHKDIPKLVDMYMDGKLPLDEFTSHRFKLEQVNDAFDLMRAGHTIRSIVLM